MYYLKILFFNFLVVFFANHILPGIEVTSQTRLPHIGGDLIFAAVLGVLNSLISPVLHWIFHSLTLLKVAMTALLLNFAGYAIIKLLPVGIHITSVEGYILVAGVVTLGSFLTNFFEMKHVSSRGPTVDKPQ